MDVKWSSEISVWEEKASKGENPLEFSPLDLDREKEVVFSDVLKVKDRLYFLGRDISGLDLHLILLG